MTGLLGNFVMRRPCLGCASLKGEIRPTNGQKCVFCADCGRFCYNAPLLEIGESPRSVRSRPDIKPSQKARIFDRDGTACVICHRDDVPLHVGHLLSVDDGKKFDVPDDEIWNDENMAVVCEECNLGFSKFTYGLRLIARILHIRCERRKRA